MTSKGKHQEPIYSYPAPEPTPIERLFLEAAKDKILNLEREQWFGDYNKKNRYRVDFLIKSKRVIIELDGRKSHLTEEQREDDAKRQRYLERSGYRVIRFTGREIVRDVKQCVDEVSNFIESLDIQYSIHRQVMYIDQKFINKEICKGMDFYKKIYPNKNLTTPALENIVIQILDWLTIKSDVEVYIFTTDLQDLKTLNFHNTTHKYKNGTLKYRVYNVNLIAVEILEHLEYHAIYYDSFILVADDPAYIPFPECVNANSPAQLVRCDSYNTSMIGNGLERLRWQDITYIVGSTMGLKAHEL